VLEALRIIITIAAIRVRVRLAVMLLIAMVRLDNLSMVGLIMSSVNDFLKVWFVTVMSHLGKVLRLLVMDRSKMMNWGVSLFPLLLD